MIKLNSSPRVLFFLCTVAFSIFPSPPVIDFPMTASAPASADLAAAAAARDFACTLSARGNHNLQANHRRYVIGSLAHGGFSRRYSDIDLALITERGLDQAALKRAARAGARVVERARPQSVGVLYRPQL
jgi:hypothetical protein